MKPSPDNAPVDPSPADGKTSDWWNVFFAQVKQALGPTPTINQVKVASKVHNHSLCFAGGGCASAGIVLGWPFGWTTVDVRAMAAWVPWIAASVGGAWLPWDASSPPWPTMARCRLGSLKWRT